MKGTSAAVVEQALKQLAPEEIELWFSLALEALTAELRQQPRTGGRSQSERDQLGALLDRLSDSDRELLIEFMPNPRQATAEDACMAGRVLYRNLGDLPEPHRAVLARALVTP